ncbi:TIR domain-containing protein [Rahnella variigena]|uniref:TIR domain-containing protein n=1 Tax=Rahnella variigena TaxID=574964 RepID=UPI001FCA2252|nr:TIR domain-containing protein [Rahnella variigena]
MSYTTRDDYIDKELLESISDVLSTVGHCYIDLLHNTAKDKQRHVEFMLLQANLIILIASNSIFSSKWVRWELEEAKKRSIPIIIVKAEFDKINTLKNLELMLLSHPLFTIRTLK